MKSVTERLAEELHVRLPQVDAAIALLDDKATVPFIARYRKEATGGLDDTQLRTLEERLTYLRELEERRAAILKSIEEQGKLTPELAAAIRAAETKARLEDLYLPYKPKRRTRAQIAREAGLEPLALALLADPRRVPARGRRRTSTRSKGVADAAAALEGARWILIETLRRGSPSWSAGCAQLLWDRGEWRSTVVAGKEEEGAKFSDYFNASEPVKQMPSHRALALLRGRKEGVLRLAVDRCRRTTAPPARRSRSAASRRAPASTQPGPRRRRVAGRDRALDLEGQAARAASSSRSSSGCASRPKPKRSACSAATCTTCCSPRRPASA